MTSSILIVTGDSAWTQRALHLAGAMAGEVDATVVILRMVPVAHLEYLGAGAREALLPYHEFDALREYAAITESYNVAVRIELFEYSDYIGGVLSAAEQFGASAVFAPAPVGFAGWLARLQLWWLRRSLRRPLYTLSEGDGPLIRLSVPAVESVTAVSQPGMSLR